MPDLFPDTTEQKNWVAMVRLRLNSLVQKINKVSARPPEQQVADLFLPTKN
jgi:hypothetical protein